MTGEESRPQLLPGETKTLRETRSFWYDALALQGSITPLVLPSSLVFSLLALGVCLLYQRYHQVAVEVGLYEVVGALLGLVLVLRSNAGYDRWWEARKVWGGIVNQSRNLVIIALSNGPQDPKWQEQLVRFSAAFPHVCRRSLRGERNLPEVAALLPAAEAQKIVAAQHMPGYVALQIARLLKQARDDLGMNGFAYLQCERERSDLINHIGACERILKTPIPTAYSIKIRGFILLYLATLPFALVQKLEWLTPIALFLAAYPILSIDQVGVELQNPFSRNNMSHLPLDRITLDLETNLLALHKAWTEGRGKSDLSG